MKQTLPSSLDRTMTKLGIVLSKPDEQRSMHIMGR